MIFQPDEIELVKARRKSQTRRLWPSCRVRAGQKYSVQPARGQRGVFDITILAVRQERLGEISQQDVRREGFRFRKQFEERWEELHGRFDAELVVWVITFAFGDLRDHFDRPRLLKATPGHAGESVEEHQDYTEQPRLAMRDAGESPDRATLERFTVAARTGEARRAKDPDLRLRDALVRELDDWRERSGGSASDRGRQKSIDRIQRELRALDRKLKVA